MAYAPPPPHHHHYGAHPPPPPPQPQQLPQRPPDLSPLNGQRRNLVFSLEVVQQPERARMCGFGDKVSGYIYMLLPQDEHSPATPSFL